MSLIIFPVEVFTGPTDLMTNGHIYRVSGTNHGNLNKLIKVATAGVVIAILSYAQWYP
jgi:hypothetical protein